MRRKVEGGGAGAEGVSADYLAEKRKLYLSDLYEKVGWPLYQRYGHAFDAFKLALTEDNEDPFLAIKIPTDLKDELRMYIRRRLAPQPIKIRSDVEVGCYTYEGIDAIREVFF